MKKIVVFALIAIALIAAATMSSSDSHGKKSDSTPAIPAIQYKVVRTWSIPGGTGKDIVIPARDTTDESLTRLGNQLAQETKDDRSAFIHIFTSAKAARMAHGDLDRLSKKDGEFYDAHNVGSYLPNDRVNEVDVVLGKGKIIHL